MHDPLDHISINDALRILDHCRQCFERLALDFEPDEDALTVPDTYLLNCVDIALDFYWHGFLRGDE